MAGFASLISWTNAVALSSPDPKRPTLGMAELIAMTSALMALNALSIDIMLPALPDIGRAFDALGNERQLVITSYVLGFGIAQIFYGPLADALGRRTVLLVSLGAYSLATLLCLAAPDFGWMLAARALQGAAAAGTRVIATAVVRDLVSGRKMAQIISIAMTFFMAAPILAPGLGQAILLVASWEWIFGALLAGGGLLWGWMLVRLPETLSVENRIPIRIRSALKNYWLAASNRITLGYMMAAAFIFGGLFAFIATAEQIMAELYGLDVWFALAFAGIAAGLAVSNIINARIVQRFGMRKISHTAIIGFTLINGGHAFYALMADPPFWLFYPLLTLGMMLFGMMGANFSALVMEPAGKRAGTTSALYGSVTAIGGAILGSLIGQSFDGSVFPLLAGMAGLGLAALVIVAITERGQMFSAGEAEADAPSP
ncbi:multidrug effflux MFS transporter [Glycocaulis albus]|uniref:multidrug effflux MFS transporter n=1 Tax=Glycocaulis albus TaxID=1382801 RepID=UPI001F2AE19C|nr:multidrug effflux MFS transporter [Glycocaulis albus]